MRSLIANLHNIKINYMSIGIAQHVCSIMTVHALTNPGNKIAVCIQYNDLYCKQYLKPYR